MEGEVSLAPYSKEQVAKGEKLPERISSIRHDVETGEMLKLDYVLEQVGNVSQAVASKTDKRFVVMGSMGMYITLDELRSDGSQLMLLEQRIASGRNDYDIGVHPETATAVMTDFGWDEERQRLNRGYIGEGWQMVDLLSRRELPHFPWRHTEVTGIPTSVQAPEEMIFEKMSALINPGTEDEGETKGGVRAREVKWGVDIKLLKTYLMEKNSWSEDQVETHLAQRWSDYIEDTRYQGVAELTERVAKGESVDQVVRDEIKRRLGKTQVEDPKSELEKILPGASDEIEQLLSSPTPDIFSANMRGLIDRTAGKRLTYEEASKLATQEYNVLLKTPDLYKKKGEPMQEERVIDKRIAKDEKQVADLMERMKADKVGEGLETAYKLLDGYAQTKPGELRVEFIDGAVGEGTIEGRTIELQLPNQEATITQLRGFVEQRLPGQGEPVITNTTQELACALVGSTGLHEGVHGLLDSKPGSKFAQDFEKVTGLSNEQGIRTTLLDEGIAYAIQGLYAPEIQSIGSLAPVAKDGERPEVAIRKRLGETLRPKIKEYIDVGRSIDSEFLLFAGQEIARLESEAK